MDTSQLKAELKSFERAFKEKHGRPPTKEDIKKAPGMEEKYKRFKALSKSRTDNRSLERNQPVSKAKNADAKRPPTTPPRAGPKPSPPHSIIRKSRPEETVPPARTSNPFSPVKRKSNAPTNLFPSALQAKSPISNLFTTPPKTQRHRSPSPDPFPLINPMPALLTVSHSSDPALVNARKRLRGEQVEDDSKEKRRRVDKGIRSRSQAPVSLFAPRENELADSPVKPGTKAFPSIFDEGPTGFNNNRRIFGRAATLPVGGLFGSRNSMDLHVDEELGHEASKAPSSPKTGTSRNLTKASTVKKRSLSMSESDSEDVCTQKATILLPPSPPPTSSDKGKGKGKWKERKKPKLAPKVIEGEEESEDGDDPIQELDWRTFGPLHSCSKTAPTLLDDDRPHLELDPTLDVGRSVTRDIEDEDEEVFDVDLPDNMRRILAISSPSKRQEEELKLAHDVLAGTSRRPGGQVWGVGEVDEHEGEEDDWEGEAVGWWEAEL